MHSHDSEQPIPGNRPESAVPGTRPRRYSLDVSVARSDRDPVEALQRGWADQVGDLLPLPPVTAMDADYRVAIVHSRVHDLVVEDVYSDGVLGGTGGHYNHLNGRVVVHVVRRGEWRFANSRDRSWVRAAAGDLCIRYNDPPWQFGVGATTRALVLQLPADELRTLVGDEAILVAQSDPAVRLLTGYLGVLTETLDDLDDIAVGHGREALMELFRAVLAHRVVADEPRLAPALVRAAKDLADARLLDADLGPADLAAALHVSVRTLHRAFAASGGSVMSYVRARRLDRARLELTAPCNRLSVSELAARWCFSDSSHFTRAFKQRFRATPTAYARSPHDRGAGPDTS